MKRWTVAAAFVMCVWTPASARVQTPTLEPGASLDACWWPEDAPVETSEGCAQHRDGVMSRWRNHGSYYALLEIVEGPLHNGLGTLKREAVIELLGTRRMDPDYPNSRRDGFLVWGSERSLPVGSYLVVQFDRNGVAHSYDWVSE